MIDTICMRVVQAFGVIMWWSALAKALAPLPAVAALSEAFETGGGGPDHRELRSSSGGGRWCLACVRPRSAHGSSGGAESCALARDPACLVLVEGRSAVRMFWRLRPIACCDLRRARGGGREVLRL